MLKDFPEILVYEEESCSEPQSFDFIAFPSALCCLAAVLVFGIARI